MVFPLARDMSSIGSYVFFDTETTGIPYRDIGETKITELTLIGVVRSHFDLEPFSPPRPLNTLTLCLNPMGHIGHFASQMTGLTNDMLDLVGPFDGSVCTMIKSFIERLPQPACLISHNGSRFDFPILQSHLKSLKMELPQNLLCADSLKAFRELKVMEKQPCEWRQLSIPLEEEADKEKECWSPSQAIDEIEITCKNGEHRQLLFDGDDCLFTQIDEEQILSQRNGYSTPTKQIHIEPRTPVKNRIKSDVRNETTPNAKRRLYNTNSVSYKLGVVHQHVMGVDISNAHTSYSDTYAMLSIVTAIGNPFHDWLLKNSVLFSTIEKIW